MSHDGRQLFLLIEKDRVFSIEVAMPRGRRLPDGPAIRESLPRLLRLAARVDQQHEARWESGWLRCLRELMILCV